MKDNQSPPTCLSGDCGAANQNGGAAGDQAETSRKEGEKLWTCLLSHQTGNRIVLVRRTDTETTEAQLLFKSSL